MDKLQIDESGRYVYFVDVYKRQLEPPGTLIRPPPLSLWSLSYKFQIDYA